MYQKYKKQIKDGPKWKCASCGRLWFKSSVSRFTVNDFVAKGLSKDFILATCPEMQIDGTENNLCSTCRRYILKSEIPKLSLFYKELQFPKIPVEIKILHR